MLKFYALLVAAVAGLTAQPALACDPPAARAFAVKTYAAPAAYGYAQTYSYAAPAQVLEVREYAVQPAVAEVVEVAPYAAARRNVVLARAANVVEIKNVTHVTPAAVVAVKNVAAVREVAVVKRVVAVKEVAVAAPATKVTVKETKKGLFGRTKTTTVETK